MTVARSLAARIAVALAALGLSLAAFTSLTESPARGQTAATSTSTSSSSSIIGSWELTFSSPTGQFAPFKGATSFTPGGVLLVSDTMQLSSNSHLGHGAWIETATNIYTARGINFGVGPDGNYDKRGQLSIRLSSSATNLSATGTFQSTDAAGDVVFSTQVAVRGTRITAQ